MPFPTTRSSTRKAMVGLQVDNSNCKRNVDFSPEGGPIKKRTVFDDITNATEQIKLGNKTTKRRSLKAEKELIENLKIDLLGGKSNGEETNCSSQKSSASSTSSYKTADESIDKSQNRSRESGESTDFDDLSISLEAKNDEPVPSVSPRKDLPKGVVDHDFESWLDPFSSSCYVKDIFSYYKEREAKFSVDKYLDRQPRLSRSMRAILVDWLVEVQESFELNHESLYLAVKLVDMFLARTPKIMRDILQLIGVSAIFIACKFDERCPPVVDDFLYICDDAYTRKQLLTMEIQILKTIDFDLGAPLSYSFLRRYSRCAKLSMETLTLARYILELTLMKYEFIVESDSKIAAATLWLALKMKKISEWTPTLQYYSGYKDDDLLPLLKEVNKSILEQTTSNLHVIRNKYSHKAFYEVAKTPLIQIDEE